MAPTPILDLERDPPKPSRRGLWIWLIVIVVWSIAVQFIRFDSLPHLNGLLFLPMLYAAVAIHEVGHLVAGKLAGMKPGGIVVGGFILYKSGRNWVFRFDYRRILSGGIAKPLPPKGEFRVAPFTWMVAGGPLSNVLLALVCALWLHYAGPSEIAGTFFWMNALLAISSSLPYSSGANKSDGARILLLLRRPAEARAWIALLMIMAEEAAGALPREWDAELCGLAFAPVAGAREFSYVRLLAFYRALDLGREQEALECLESCLACSAKNGKLLRHCYFLEAACTSASLRNSATRARTWLARARQLRKPDSTSGIEAAIAICENRFADALRHIADVRAYLDKRKLDSGLARFLRERLALMGRQCEEQLASSKSQSVAGS